jgi:hypothetical protein
MPEITEQPIRLETQTTGWNKMKAAIGLLRMTFALAKQAKPEHCASIRTTPRPSNLEGNTKGVDATIKFLVI